MNLSDSLKVLEVTSLRNKLALAEQALRLNNTEESDQSDIDEEDQSEFDYIIDDS